MDAISKFKEAILDAIGTTPAEVIGDGVIHRFYVDGKLNGWYILHLDGKAAGSYGDWKQGIKHTWKQNGAFMPLSEFQRQNLAKKRAADEAALHEAESVKHDEAANKAVSIWSTAPPAPPTHPYLVKKRINCHGARLGRGNALIIPLHNKAGDLVNLQFISESGGKRFLAGALKKGCFYRIGDVTDTILICEGFATGASLFDDAGYLTVVAFDAGNLKEVAINIKSLYPYAEIIICADNDASNIGEKKAIEAALAIGAKYIMPPMPGDFNDMLSGGAL